MSNGPNPPKTGGSPIYDHSKCPGCGEKVPRIANHLPKYICQGCGKWILDTGILVIPVMGPQGEPPVLARMPSAGWQLNFSTASASLPSPPDDEATKSFQKLLKLFANGVADDRFVRASHVLADGQLSVEEKLTKIDGLIGFPATASAQQLGDMLGVTKQAVLQTVWWDVNRKGEKANEVGRRLKAHKKRAEGHETPGSNEADD